MIWSSGSCSVISNVKNMIDFGHEDLGLFNVEKGSFGTRWSVLDRSKQTDPSLDHHLYSAFNYTHALDIDSYPYSGVYTTYPGGGYVFKLLGSQNELAANLSLLESMSWLDRQSRALFIEFSLFNPSVNLFAYCNVLFEMLPNGHILPAIRVSPFSLYQFNQGLSSLTIACDIIYLAFICFYMFREVREMVKLRWNYFKRLSSYVEWTIIGFSWAALAMFVYRLYSSEKIASLIRSNKPATPTLIQMQLTTYWNDALGNCLAFCACLGTIKFLNLLRFSKSVLVFMVTMKMIVRELLSFTFLFMIVYLAFVQLFYLTLSESSLGFSTFISTMETCFAIMLGKFQLNPILETSPRLGPLYFSIFNVVIIFILLNIFLSIVSDGFAKVRSELGSLEREELDVGGYLAPYLRGFFVPFLNRFKRVEKEEVNREGLIYEDTVSSLGHRVDDLIEYLDRHQHHEASALKF